MEARIIYFNEYLTLIQAVGGLFLFEEDWMKQKKIIQAKETKPEKLNDEKFMEFSNNV